MRIQTVVSMGSSFIMLGMVVVVVGATMLRYSGLRISWKNRVIYPLFYSYKEAWKDFSAREWRNIILNIMMFVPFGFLLPLVSNKLHVFWKTFMVSIDS